MPLPTSCPRCGSELEAGRVVGQMARLTWVPEGERVPWLTLLGKEALASGSLGRPPQLAATRCSACGLGLFESADRDQQGRTSTS